MNLFFLKLKITLHTENELKNYAISIPEAKIGINKKQRTGRTVEKPTPA
jgi:hypothetical protein